MSTDFIKADRDTPFLFPPSVQEWLPKDHLARFVVDMVGQLNVSSLRDVYIGKGSYNVTTSLRKKDNQFKKLLDTLNTSIVT